MRPIVVAMLLTLATAGCGSDAASVPAPAQPPQGSLLVQETRPCNWLQAPDKNKCDPVAVVRIGLDGELLEELEPEPPMPMRPMALSPDRATIAWAWNWEVSVMGVTGEATRTVSEKLLAENMGETALYPTWTPDGSELLYRWSGANAVDTWYLLAVESGGLTEVPMPVDCHAMAWAPDGGDVACEVWADSDATEVDIYLVHMETLEATQLTDSGDAIDSYTPEWSPDGNWLAFSRRADAPADPADADGIWLLEVETGKGLRVAAGSLVSPTWSPDGGHLAAYDEEQGKIVIVGRDGSGLTTLDHEPRRFIAPRWLPGD